MKLTVFQSDKGDCLLLTGSDNKTRVLIDGGMSKSYTEHVAPTLGQVRDDGGDLDVVCVSHIDQDHIEGIVQLLEDEVAWRVHDYQLDSGNNKHPEPQCPRPPAIKEIWHNGFREQLADNAGPIEEMLAASAAVLRAGSESSQHQLAASYQNLATGVSDAVELSRRVSPEQLGIPLNKAFGGKLAVQEAKPRGKQRGSLRFWLLAPRKEDLKKLRHEWNKWLVANEAALARLRARMQADIERLGANEVEVLGGLLEAQATAMAPTALAAPVLGDRKRVTAPNLASLMFLVEEKGKTLLLTGDGHSREILSGLEDAGKLERGGTIHVDVLKIQHHGSEFNIDAEFCRRVSADHYIFCANGEYANPDERVLKLILDARLRDRDGGDFRFWFNSSSKADGGDAAHMAKVERLVKGRAPKSKGRFSYSFLRDDFFELEV